MAFILYVLLPAPNRWSSVFLFCNHIFSDLLFSLRFSEINLRGQILPDSNRKKLAEINRNQYNDVMLNGVKGGIIGDRHAILYCTGVAMTLGNIMMSLSEPCRLSTPSFYKLRVTIHLLNKKAGLNEPGFLYQDKSFHLYPFRLIKHFVACGWCSAHHLL